MANMLKFSVIICAYTEDRWDDLIASVSSVKAQIYQPEQVIVVVDHNDQLFERTRMQFPEAHILKNKYEQGLSGARNTGIGIATGEIVAFMDEDAIAAPDWLYYLAKNYTDSTVMGVGGLIEPNWKNVRPIWFPREFDWVVGCTYLGQPVQAASVRNLIGCNMSFRRTVFEGIGLFRNGVGRVGTIPLGGEETEICIRARQKWPTQHFIFEPLAVVLHHVPENRGKFEYFRSRCYSEGLSKALISRFVGTRNSTHSERIYTLSVLPRGVFKGLADVFHGDFSGPLRSLAIVTGLFVTTLGFIAGNLSKTLVGTNAIPALEKIPENG